MSEFPPRDEAAEFKAINNKIIDFDTAKARLEERNVLSPHERFIATAVDYVLAHPTAKMKWRSRLMELAKIAGVAGQKELTSLELINMPLTGDMFVDTKILGVQIKNPDIALYLDEGISPVEILNDIKHDFSEGLSKKTGMPSYLVIHSQVMIGIIDRILASQRP